MIQLLLLVLWEKGHVTDGHTKQMTITFYFARFQYKKVHLYVNHIEDESTSL